jgi:hypothetical protein
LGGIPNATYLPLQEIPGEDGASGYYILVTDDKGRLNFSQEETVLPISVVERMEEVTPQAPRNKPKRKPNKND